MRILIALLGILSVATAALAQPVLGPDCPVGSTIVGNQSAGRVTSGPFTGASYTCTVENFPVANRACIVVRAPFGTNYSLFGGGRTDTPTTMTIGTDSGWGTGDVFTYQCQKF